MQVRCDRSVNLHLTCLRVCGRGVRGANTTGDVCEQAHWDHEETWEIGRYLIVFVFLYSSFFYLMFACARDSDSTRWSVC